MFLNEMLSKGDAEAPITADDFEAVLNGGENVIAVVLLSSRRELSAFRYGL